MAIKSEVILSYLGLGVQGEPSWGTMIDDAKLEPWDFGHPGWVNDRASGFITAPVKDNLTFEVLAWTPSTKGTAIGSAFNLILPDRPPQTELDTFLAGIKTKVRGKIVLVGKPAVIQVNINPPAKRRTDEEVRRQVTPNATPQAPFTPPTPPTPKPGQLNGQQIGEQLDKFLLTNGTLVRINDAGREHGQIRAFNNRTFDVTKTVPTWSCETKILAESPEF